MQKTFFELVNCLFNFICIIFQSNPNQHTTGKIIEFTDRIGRNEKNMTFEVKNGNPNSEVRKIFENASITVKKVYTVPSEELHNEYEDKITKINISKEIKENETYETEVKDEKGNLIKNANVEITLPNGEKIKVKTDEEGKVKLTIKNGKTEQIEEGKIKLSEQIEEDNVYEVMVRDNKGNLIKDGVAEITLPNGEKIKVKTDENGKVKLTNENGKIVQVENGNAELPEKIEEGKGIETEVRDSSGNLIKDGIAEISLPNGEKIKVRTDKYGKVKLMQKDGKIEQINTTNIKTPYIEENKNYEIEVRDENRNLIKNSNVSILLPTGQILNVLTDKNGKAKLQYKDGSFAQEKQEFEFR